MENIKNHSDELCLTNGTVIAKYKDGKIYIVERYFKKYRQLCIDTFKCNFFVFI